jgi:SET domain-containing protein
MGRSAIAGWGLFAGEKIKAGQFLGVPHPIKNRMLTGQEYKGEIIGNEESERRGLLYDKKGVSFLFTLNKGLQFVRWGLI